ncbi:MAG: hypothetical protein AB1724_02570 [Thermodesulfobacteriota bacterium]
MLSIVYTLLFPRALSFKNRMLYSRKIQFLLFGGIGVALWAGVFAASFRILTYFQGIEQLGEILANKLLSMIFVVILSLLVFSSVITLLSKLYLSRDLNLVHSLPVPRRYLFLARWIEATFDSAWMVVVFVLPVFIAYGIVYATGPFFYVAFLVCLLCLCVIASGISAIGVAFIVNLISASRLKTIFIFLGLALFILLYFAFRLLRPERLVDPEMFATTLVYLKSLNTPSSPWLPSTWAYDCITATLTGDMAGSLFNGLLCISLAAALILIMQIVADRIYFSGFSKTASGRVKSVRRGNREYAAVFLFFLPSHVRAFVVKEIKTFLRDQSQWSQLFLIMALIIIYVYNFKVLPLEKSPIKTVYLQNLFAFLNMGLAAFVLTAVTARFAFPAVSMEKGAFWITRSCPISMRLFVRIKFFVYLAPLFVMTIVLIIITNLLLSVTPFMMWLSLATMCLMIPAIVAMGVGLGAAYPDFASENPAQAVTSFGGFVFMAVSALYVLAVIVLEAGPAYRLFMAGIRNRSAGVEGWAWMALSFAGVAGLSGFATLFSLRFGAKKLEPGK